MYYFRFIIIILLVSLLRIYYCIIASDTSSDTNSGTSSDTNSTFLRGRNGFKKSKSGHEQKESISVHFNPFSLLGCCIQVSSLKIPTSLAMARDAFYIDSRVFTCIVSSSTRVKRKHFFLTARIYSIISFLHLLFSFFFFFCNLSWIGRAQTDKRIKALMC